jgi:hypothetical protein
MQSSVNPYEINLTASAKAAYLELRQRARAAEARNDLADPNISAFHFVDHAIRHVIPNTPENTRFALHEPLTAMFRIKKGRIRIMWVANTDLRSVVIVFISNTPCKDADDAQKYATLNRLAKAGLLGTVLDDYRKATSVPPDAPVN